MKKITRIMAAVFGLALIFSACQKMEDIHEEYLDGEIIYAPKPLMIQTFAGKNRVGVKYYLLNAQNVTECIVEWDNGEGSKSMNVTPTTPLDSVEFMIDGLEERSYLFKIYTVDNKGNRSVKEQITGSAYADRFLSSLSNRPILSIVGGGIIDSLVVRWGTPPSGNTKVEYSYTNTAGEMVNKTLMPDEDRIVIRGWKSESTFSYQSFYIPEEGAIDTFATETASEQLPVYIQFDGVKIDKTNWEVIDFSSEEPTGNGVAANTIDGDLSTFWHTQWSAAQPGYPHYFTIDLKDIVKINKIEAFRRQGDNRGQTEFQILTSLDGVNFELIGTYGYDNTVNSQSYNITSLPMARYVKYVATKGGDFFAFLAELDIYGQVAVNLDKTKWEIVDFDSEEPTEANWGPEIQGRAAAAIDGELSTFWHTDWDEDQPAYPHYFTVDLKDAVRVLAVECFKRQGKSDGPTKFRIHTSMDGENFVDQGEFDFDQSNAGGQLYPMAFLPEARYIKFEATAGPSYYAHLAEFSVYAQAAN